MVAFCDSRLLLSDCCNQLSGVDSPPMLQTNGWRWYGNVEIVNMVAFILIKLHTIRILATSDPGFIKRVKSGECYVSVIEKQIKCYILSHIDYKKRGKIFILCTVKSHHSAFNLQTTFHIFTDFFVKEINRPAFCQPSSC